MIFLIVDDQVNVVSGIVSGVDWDRLGGGTILTAYNAKEAKDLFQRQEIDILLCDIEMPVEDGISLFRWIRGEGYKTLVIFLTAHAEFMYAREILRLGGFDYIVQPARYEDIEYTLQKAVYQIQSQRMEKKYYSYGKLWYENRELMMMGLLKSFARGDYTQDEDVETALSNLGIVEKTEFHVLLFEILRWDGKPLLDGKLLCFMFENVLAELLAGYGQSVLLIQTGEEEYAVLIYSNGESGSSPVEKDHLRRQAEVFRENCGNLFHCHIAAYLDGTVHDIAGWRSEGIPTLLKSQKDNVARISAVFGVEQEPGMPLPQLLVKKQWRSLLEEGFVQSTKEDIFSYLDRKSEERSVTGKSLKLFYHEFMSMILHVAEEKDIVMKDIFLDGDNLDISLHAYGSVEKMKEFIERVLFYFETASTGENGMEGQISKIVEYIHDNIEHDIRRTDIAKAIYLNPDYVSRIFKKEMGISLKEFILVEKMKVAQTLLRTTVLPISLIAVKVGYTNFSHFSQTYKRLMNCTPAEERQQ